MTTIDTAIKDGEDQIDFFADDCECDCPCATGELPSLIGK